MNPETLKRVRAQADAYADQVIADESFGGNVVVRAAVRELLRLAYLRGADAGYTARCAEERKS